MPLTAQSNTANPPISSKKKMMSDLRATFIQNGTTTITNNPAPSNFVPPVPPTSPTSVVEPPREELPDLDILEQAITQAEQAQSQPIPPVLEQPIPVVEPELTPEVALESQALDQSLPQEVASIAQAVPGVALDQTDTLNPIAVSSPIKEQEPKVSIQELNINTTASEVEPNHEMEMPVEVESYLERVTDHQDQLPSEIVIADDGADISIKTYPSKPVVVLPISQKEEKEGEKKSTAFSVRWLVEFSRKLMKAFSGAVIYREED